VPRESEIEKLKAELEVTRTLLRRVNYGEKPWVDVMKYVDSLPEDSSAWDELAECSPSTIAAVMGAPLPAPEPARKAGCVACGGSGETEEDATGPDCAPR
jgi:hypothetical protein